MKSILNFLPFSVKLRSGSISYIFSPIRFIAISLFKMNAVNVFKVWDIKRFNEVIKITYYVFISLEGGWYLGHEQNSKKFLKYK